MSVEQELLHNFITKNEDLSSELEQQSILLEASPKSKSIINTVFRICHTIKGNSAIFGFHKLKKIAHVCEDILSMAREDKLVFSDEIIGLYLNGLSLIDKEIKRIKHNPVDESVGYEECKFFEKATKIIDDCVLHDKKESRVVTESYQYLCGEIEVTEIIQKIEKYLQISMTDEMSPDNSGFLEGLCEIYTVFTENGDIELAQLAEKMQNDFEMMIDDAGIPSLLLLNLMKEGLVKIKSSLKCIEKHHVYDAEQEVKLTIENVKPTFRVEEERIEELLKSIGVIKDINSHFRAYQNDFNSQLEKGMAEVFNKELNQLGFVVENLEGMLAGIQKARPDILLGTVSNLVLALARSCKKKIRIETRGADVAISRSKLDVLEKILVHIVRNSIDHGIEKPEERKEYGKDEEGVIKVEFFEGDGQVTIVISDDGRGINFEALRNDAVKKNIIKEDELLYFAGARAAELLFFPGVSTSKKVTDLSGRGVGMDVVKEAVSNMGGTITVSSKAGEGTTFLLKL